MIHNARRSGLNVFRISDRRPSRPPGRQEALRKCTFSRPCPGLQAACGQRLPVEPDAHRVDLAAADAHARDAFEETVRRVVHRAKLDRLAQIDRELELAAEDQARSLLIEK